jgi:hypothetical protein
MATYDEYRDFADACIRWAQNAATLPSVTWSENTCRNFRLAVWGARGARLSHQD